MRIGVFLIISILVAVLGTAHAETPVITVSTNNTPLDRKALQELSQEAFRRAGLAIKLVSLPSERSLQSANAGEVDGEGLRVAGLNSQYANLVQVPEPLLRQDFVAMTTRTGLVVRGWDDLRPLAIYRDDGFKRSVEQVPTRAFVDGVAGTITLPDGVIDMRSGEWLDARGARLGACTAMKRRDGYALMREFLGRAPAPGSTEGAAPATAPAAAPAPAPTPAPSTPEQAS